MHLKNRFGRVLETVDLLAAELRSLRSQGPCFMILHRFHNPGSDCTPGEEAAAVLLHHHGREYRVPLPPTRLLLFDFLARRSRIPLSGSQIVTAMSVDPFAMRHGLNATSSAQAPPKIQRSCLKIYVQRIRLALKQCFDEAGLKINPHDVLASQTTVSNRIGYRLIATCEWIHEDTIDRVYYLRLKSDA